MQVGKYKHGFTIVELLIVIVVIGILAAITIVAYNGVTKRAAVASVQSELLQNAKAITAAGQTSASSKLSTIDAMPGGAANVRFTATNYKVFTYCTDGTSYVLSALTTTGDTYYIKNGTAMVQDNSIDDYLPCSSLSISSAKTTYLNLPTQCAVEGGTCTFTGTATVAYGSTAQAMFTRVVNVTGPVTCSTAALAVSDPAAGYTKACFVYPN